MAADAPAFTPVNLLTGFLGSGKTTLLRRLLADPALARAAVLINEFGEVGLDHHLVERIDETMVLLPSGCLCCTIRGELAQAIRAIHGKRERGEIPAFDRLVIESTGLADPFPILTTLKADPVLRHHVRPGTVVATVDAVNGAFQLDTHVESTRQAAIADRLVLTKTDIAEEVAVAGLVARLRHLNPDAPILAATEADCSAATLFAQEGSGPDRSTRAWFRRAFRSDDPTLAEAPGGPEEGTRHGGRIRSFVVTVDEPIDWTAFGIWLTMLLNRHGDRILRVKGILNLAGEQAPVAIHGVQHLVHTPVHMRAWPDGDRRSRIVFIVDDLDSGLIRRSLAAFNRVAAVEPQR
ncbi:CobW family GTP-binding protein [Labrys wisconsinensis]|uniref:G3E family GTPase n=1 Tax=Labrys wisconsinensis TaxID=425677 RepID=A0ABU0JD22_9HYPH|nr:GTP-binding protein [Labrys wisconsinensis]MDQ0472173.1 G3E family GTPase [Labrys wisconsinensis]